MTSYFGNIERNGISEENERQTKRSDNTKNWRLERHIEHAESGRPKCRADTDKHCHMRQATLVDQAREQR